MRTRNLVRLTGLALAMAFSAAPAFCESQEEVIERAVALYWEGKKAEARGALEERIASHPEDLDAHLGYCRLRVAMGEGEKVRREYAELSATDPGNAVLGLVALVLMPSSLEKNRKFEAFTEMHPDLGWGWEEMGRYYLDQFRPGQAVDPLRRAAKLLPDRPEPRLYIGLAYRALEELENEAEMIEAAYFMAPDNTLVALEWGVTNLYGGRLEQAIELLEAAATERTHDGHVAALLALAYLRDSQVDEAEKWTAVALDRYPTLFDGLVFRGIQLRSAGQRAEAKRAFNLVISLEPDHVEAYMQLGILHRLMEQPDSAIATYITVTEVEEGSMSQLAWRNLGVSHGDKGEYELAEQYIRKSLEVDPDYLLGWVDLARVLGVNGRFDEATAMWRKVIGMAPYGWEAREARETLYYLEQGQVPPGREEGRAGYVSPLKGMKPEDAKGK